MHIFPAKHSFQDFSKTMSDVPSNLALQQKKYTNRALSTISYLGSKYVTPASFVDLFEVLKNSKYNMLDQAGT